MAKMEETMIKNIAFVCAALVIVGCSKPEVDLTKISVGMTKEEAISRLGKPTRVSVLGGLEYLEYESYDAHNRPFVGVVRENYRFLFVRIVNGKVDAFGSKGDFDTTKNKTNDLHIDQKITTRTEGGASGTGAEIPRFDLATELRKLDQLKKDGLITQQEFDTLRQKAIDKAKAQ